MKMNTTRTAFTRGTKGASVALMGLLFASCGSGSGSDATNADSGNDSGVTVDKDLTDQLEEVQGELEEMIESGSLGSGSGLITIEGFDYEFEATTCYSEPNAFEASGHGEGPDGVPFYASLSYGAQTRQSMLNAGLPQESVDTMFGDSDLLESFGLGVELGKVSLFEPAPDGLPEFKLDVIGGMEFGEADYTIDGNTISGTGTVTDHNGIALDSNEAVPVAYSATCN